ncbi:MAG: tetratricopeptide repeat protein, partial [Dongiaceae bacterium]
MDRRDRVRSGAAKSLWLALCLSFGLALAACDGAQDREARYLERGQELFDQGDYVKASLEFRNALQINPTSIHAMFYLGRIAESQGDLSNALGAFTKVVEQDPKNVPALLKISQYALLTQNLDEARSRADQVLAV